MAVTDPLQLIAGGLATVATSELYDWLVQYVKREPVERIIIGEPRQMNGQPSENMPSGAMHRFTALRFTSVLAHQTMLDGGLHKKARQDKALVDQISATIILQNYLESRRRFTPNS